MKKKKPIDDIIFEIKVLDRINNNYEKKLETWYIRGVKELDNWYRIMKKRHG